MRRSLLLVALVGALAVATAGCAANGFKGQIGVTTFDQVVQEMGAPKEKATLGDGDTEAIWILDKSHIVEELLGQNKSRSGTRYKLSVMRFDEHGVLKSTSTRTETEYDGPFR